MSSRGLLTFKGRDGQVILPSRPQKNEKKVKKEKKKRKRKRNDDKGSKEKKKKRKRRERSSSVSSGTGSDSDSTSGSENGALKRRDGTGSIFSSYTIVSGNGCRFKSEVEAGDVIVVCPHPLSGKEEARLVSMVNSDTNLTISKPFSLDIDTPCAFKYLSKPKDASYEKEKTRLRAEQLKQELQQAFGTYAGSQGEVTYRERVGKGGSGLYRIVKHKTDRELTREEQLELRSKRKGDKFC